MQGSTGFKLDFEEDVALTEPPTNDELQTLRLLDPERLFTA